MKQSFNFLIVRLANSARIVSSIAILLTNPLQFYIAIIIIFPALIAPRVREDRQIFWEYVLRYSIIAVCCKWI